MKLLKRDRASLETVRGQLERAAAFMADERTVLCRRKRMATTTLDFTNQQGEICCQIDSGIGSEFALFWSALHNLKSLLAKEPD
jgi:hypothetical protein